MTANESPSFEGEISCKDKKTIRVEEHETKSTDLENPSIRSTKDEEEEEPIVTFKTWIVVVVRIPFLLSISIPSPHSVLQPCFSMRRNHDINSVYRYFRVAMVCRFGPFQLLPQLETWFRPT